MMDTDLGMHNASASTGISHPPPLLLSDDETRILELYDRLQELSLEIALLKARQEHIPDASTEVASDELSLAQEQLLEARAAFVLRTDVVDAVITVNPILRAVHHATFGSPIERDLLSHIEQRDTVSISAAQLAEGLKDMRKELTNTQAECLGIGRENVQLASEVLQLANDATERNKASSVHSHATNELQRLEGGLKTSRQRWKLMKGTASAVVAGSGIDWVRNPHLRSIVLDPE